DRLGHPTTFGYVDPDATNNIQTTVTDAENHATTYLQDGYGRPIETTNAKSQTTKLGWDDDHNVTRLEEANTAVSTWAYDAKTGYPTEIKDAEAVKNGTSGTILAYQRQLNGYVADLTEKTSPEGRKHTFGYEADGDVSWVVDPIGNTTTATDDYKTSYTYDAWGQLLTAKDANGSVTTNSNFDPNGYPQTISDALSKQTKFVYDVRGQVTTVTDALNHDTTQTYDTFGRKLEQTTAKDESQGQFITTPAPVYDANGNVSRTTGPNGAVVSYAYSEADQVVSMTAPKNTDTEAARVTTYTYDKVGNTLTTTKPKGNQTSTAGDYVTTNTYDEIYQLVAVVNPTGERVSYEYDNVGNVSVVVDPRRNATTDTMDYANKYTYDLAHRVVSAIDAAGKAATDTYDKDGLVTAVVDKAGSRATIKHNARGDVIEVRVPHENSGGVVTDRVTRYEYDQVGNRTKTITPRGVATTDDADDFSTVNMYDALNRVKETQSQYDRDDPRYTAPDKTTYTYDAVGRMVKVSAPASQGQTVRNDTTYTYYDNGWVRSSIDPWDIADSYDYNEVGQQKSRTVISAGGSSSRTMSWGYYPDGKIKSRTDDGVPVGKQVDLVDNADANNASSTGTWTVAGSAPGQYFTDYATAPAGTGGKTFTWRTNIRQTGTYEVFVRYPQVAGAASDSKFTIKHSVGSTVKTVNQATGSGTWVSIGSYAFSEGGAHDITLTDQATGTVVADVVKLVRDNSADLDNEKHDYMYEYDANGNAAVIRDNSLSAGVDTYQLAYSMSDQVIKTQELKSGQLAGETSFTYDENGASKTVLSNMAFWSYEYDPRGAVSKITTGKSASDPAPEVTTYTYTDRGERLKEVKANGNVVEYSYFMDGLPKTAAETKSDGTVVAQHTLQYDLNGNRTRDVVKLMNADDHGAYLNAATDYTYDPRDRVSQATRTGDAAGTESYVHDANGNVVSQVVNGTSSSLTYDRNRLVGVTAGTVSSSYNYDPFGRLDVVNAGGQLVERTVYDGFDHVAEKRRNVNGAMSVSRYTYDAFDRTTSRTTGVGSGNEKDVSYNYVGLFGEVVNESTDRQVTKSYQYAPSGERLSQTKHNADGTEESVFYGYNAHTDVEGITDQSGNTKATYGYTAYGKDDAAQFTGVDKPSGSGTFDSYNAYRFNGKRWDSAAGSYDMGFRDYDPGLNRFLTRDTYNGAMNDMRLGLDPWTGNRYAFAGGNPISRVELDGHCPTNADGDGCSSEPSDRRGGDDSWGVRDDGVSEGGRTPDDHGDWLDTDWAGLAILQRYLRGGDDWRITNDPAWNKYMMQNRILSDQLLPVITEVAGKALGAYRSSGMRENFFYKQFHINIQNGEGLVGYEYLHGTNPDVGDFQVGAFTSSYWGGSSGGTVEVFGQYTWNDIIDPNYNYTTDQQKNQWAEIISFGMADPYNIHITWHALTIVMFNASADVSNVVGYPAS
ncbi:hypothetical protein KBX37_30360, partial [Micromonospora sp. U56]|uniref:golvesin C-terminal-like domain-containing protein n=1 Tax=Micromonospora sp. U56 TaxID=2824900 RepID=UPI001B39A4DB